MKNYMAIDQYGETYHDLGEHPRKKLLEILDGSHASKMYVDSKDNKSIYHVGYVIKGLWLTLYKIEPMRILQ
jgi:hypothetical protein